MNNNRRRNSAPKESECIRICPHQTLTHDQLHQLATLPLENPTHSLDIFSERAPPHLHSHLQSLQQSTSKPNYLRRHDDDTRFPLSVTSFKNNFGLQSGFALYASWDMVFTPYQNGAYVKKKIYAFLETSNISLCPHMRISDDDIVNTVCSLLSRASDTTLHCQDCTTSITIAHLPCRPEDGGHARYLIKVKRVLGNGKSKDDLLWRSQCVLSDEDEGGERSAMNSGERFCCGVQYLRGIVNAPEAKRLWNEAEEMRRKVEEEGLRGWIYE